MGSPHLSLMKRATWPGTLRSKVEDGLESAAVVAYAADELLNLTATTCG